MPSNQRKRVKQTAKTETVSRVGSVANAAGNNEVPPPSRSETLRRLYVSLLRSRRVQENVRNASGLAGSGFELRLGHEAVVAGATAELTAADSIVACANNFAAQIARGAPLNRLLAAVADGALKSWGFAPVMPEDPFHAGVGIALAHKLEQKRNVVVAFCAQPNPTVVEQREALKFAASHRLPIVFVIESEPERATDGHAPYLKAVSFTVRHTDIPGIVVDGSDVVAVWRVAHEAVHRARYGSGPTFIDCRTDPAHDPLAHMERYLRKRDEWDDAWRGQVELDIKREIENAIAMRSRSETAPALSGQPRTTSPA